MARALMLQGTGSDVGKSVLTAAICRLAKRRGLSVAPFKPQNMSNNAAACASGGEIGRAQALQAQACGLAPHVDMNPVLLKPQTDKIVEGAGSPAEINLRARDIANMGFARRAGVPVCLIGDIERGGVIASLVGTKAVIDPKDAAMIRGFLVNKFRGDLRLFDDGVTEIETRTGWPCLGVIPWLPATVRLPAEDAVVLSRAAEGQKSVVKIAAPMLSRMANFDDADPLKMEPNVEFEWIPPGKPIPRDADVIILFGTKSTLGDLAFLRAQGWDHDIMSHARAGGRVLGVCGGYQMLGREISDPHGVDGPAGVAKGLGLLEVDTIMTQHKHIAPVEAMCASSGMAITGYEIHMGQTKGADSLRPFANIDGAADGATSANGKIQGTYLHGAFSSNSFRQFWLTSVGAEGYSDLDFNIEVERAIDNVADGVGAAIDIDALLALAKPTGWSPDIV